MTAGSSGQVVFDFLNSTLYTLRVVATNRHPDKEFIKGTFRLTSDPDQCTVHLINCGVTVFGDMASVEFAGRGPATGYQCTFDMMEPYQCKYTESLALVHIQAGEVVNINYVQIAIGALMTD